MVGHIHDRITRTTHDTDKASIGERIIIGASGITALIISYKGRDR